MSNFWQRLRTPPVKPSPKSLPASDGSLTTRLITRTWYPLALSWTVMSFEGVIISAMLARMPDPEISLAAYGGVAFAIAFVLSAPISSMLSVSTTLSRNWQAFTRLRRFVLALGSILTAIYALVAFTPLYYWVVENLIGAPAEIVEPGRLGLMILMPFPMLVGFRRLQQGVMIRFGQSSGVTVSTVLRIITESILMLLGFLDGRLPGIVVAAGSQTIGMFIETLYAWLRARPIIQRELKAVPVESDLTWKALLRFFVPLSLSTIVAFSFQFINSAGMSRMPFALESLAVYPVASGLSWLLQGPAVAWLEPVVALVDRKKSVGALRRFTGLLFGGSLLLSLLFMVTPLSMLWFTRLSSLSAPLAKMANTSMWFLMLSTGLCVLQVWFQGMIMHGRRTRALTEAIVVSLVVELVIMVGGVITGRFTGLYVASFAFLLAYAAQVFWLYLRSRPIARELNQRDEQVQIVLSVE